MRETSRFPALHHHVEELLPHFTKPMSAGLKDVYDKTINLFYKTRYPEYLTSLDIFNDWKAKIDEHDGLSSERLTAEKVRQAEIDMEINQQVSLGAQEDG